MFKSYFFIPSNNKRFIEKVTTLKADNFVFDLEDSVTFDEIEVALSNLKDLRIEKNYFVRLNCYHTDEFSAGIINALIDIGFRNFLIPKFESVDRILSIKDVFEHNGKYFRDEFQFILLVEHPAGVINLDKAIKAKLLNITGVGFGSHDYCNTLGMKHTLSNLSYARLSVLNSAKAFGLLAIDIVSTDLKNDECFIEEVRDGFSLGFDGKFLIYPGQLDLFKQFELFTKDEVDEALLVYEQLLINMDKQVAVLKINGKVYEKPHMKRILQIVDWYKQFNIQKNGN